MNKLSEPVLNANETLRLHRLDALRACALLLGVVPLANMAYLSEADYFWIEADSKRARIASSIFFLIHLFRMPLFFMLAGFSAYVKFQNKGSKAFVKDRLQRTLLTRLAELKIMFVVAFTLTLLIALGTYHLFVRFTWIGRILNGKLYFKKERAL